jgi:hypothetical protein
MTKIEFLLIVLFFGNTQSPLPAQSANTEMEQKSPRIKASSVFIGNELALQDSLLCLIEGRMSFLLLR